MSSFFRVKANFYFLKSVFISNMGLGLYRGVNNNATHERRDYVRNNCLNWVHNRDSYLYQFTFLRFILYARLYRLS